MISSLFSCSLIKVKQATITAKNITDPQRKFKLIHSFSQMFIEKMFSLWQATFLSLEFKDEGLDPFLQECHNLLRETGPSPISPWSLCSNHNSISTTSPVWSQSSLRPWSSDSPPFFACQNHRYFSSPSSNSTSEKYSLITLSRINYSTSVISIIPHSLLWKLKSKEKASSIYPAFFLYHSASREQKSRWEKAFKEIFQLINADEWQRKSPFINLQWNDGSSRQQSSVDPKTIRWKAVGEIKRTPPEPTDHWNQDNQTLSASRNDARASVL